MKKYFLFLIFYISCSHSMKVDNDFLDGDKLSEYYKSRNNQLNNNQNNNPETEKNPKLTIVNFSPDQKRRESNESKKE